MEAKNFRIGNLIQDFYKQEPYVIDADGIKLCFLIEKEGRYQTTMHSGIPLTEEWLLKFGFERNRNFKREFDYLSNEDYKKIKMVNHYENGWLIKWHWWEYGKMINYVHELQNLFFAINDTELELKS